jgi:hypothetical protein
MYMARKTGKKHFYAAGTGIYALSWGMMILGAAMVGPHGISHARAILSRDVVLSLLLLLLLGIAYYVWKERRP